MIAGVRRSRAARLRVVSQSLSVDNPKRFPTRLRVMARPLFAQINLAALRAQSRARARARAEDAGAGGGQGERLRPRTHRACCRRSTTPTGSRSSSSTQRSSSRERITPGASCCSKASFAPSELPEFAAPAPRHGRAPRGSGGACSSTRTLDTPARGVRQGQHRHEPAGRSRPRKSPHWSSGSRSAPRSPRCA